MGITNITITMVDLDNNNIRVEEGTDLSNALQVNTTITTIILNDNALQVNMTITTIRLNGNTIRICMYISSFKCMSSYKYDLKSTDPDPSNKVG